MKLDPVVVYWAIGFIIGTLGLITLGLVCIGIFTTTGGKNNEND